MTREETKKRFKSWCQEHIGNNASDEDYHMFNNIMALLEQEPCCEQIKWERDTAIAQLKELGYGLGEKPKTDVLDKIRAEIEQVVAEESKEDLKWALGLKYSIKIIDKYRLNRKRGYEAEVITRGNSW